MRVGIDGRELQGLPTGIGRYLRNLLRIWAEAASDDFFVYFNGPVAPHLVTTHRRIFTRALGDAATRGLLWQERRLPHAAQRDALDVFFSPAYVCPLSLRVPRVTTVHDLSFFSVPHDFSVWEGLRRRALVSRSLSASERVLAPSEFTRREIAGWFPDVADRVIHIPQGADDDLSPPPTRETARARLGLRGPLLITVGSLFNRRNLPVLLRAVASLAARWPTLTLDVVGENRTHPTIDFGQLAHRLGIERQVRLSGFVGESELADRYAAADVAIFLSDYEGFGLPVLESMARGVPVVASARPCLGEMFGGAALRVSPEDPKGVAATIDRLLGDGALRERLRRDGRALSERYSWRQTAALTYDALAQAAR